MHPEELSAGVVVGGRYRLEAELARGGESRVFRAAELRTGRQVALKALARDPADKTWVSRFRREANLARQLQHPNTVRLLDFDVDAESLPFIVYELLQGQTLRSLIQRQGALGEARAVRIATQILKALMESHAVGVVHRDIKPDNVFVCDFPGESDYVKVLDFGIAKSMESEATVLTSDGMLVGTPRYMSPDQIRGYPPVPNMDLYAVGLLLAEMLTGSPVVTEEHAEACRRQLSPEPLLLSTAVRASALGPIIERAIQKEPAQRFQLAGQFLTSLSACAASGSIPPPAIEATLDQVPVEQLLGQAPLPAPAPAAQPSVPPAHHPSAAPPGPAPSGGSRTHPLLWLSLGVALVGLLLGAAALVVAVLR
ncbi:MAG: serine/threonine-protein kinase [Polyangiaceae bacterium]